MNKPHKTLFALLFVCVTTPLYAAQDAYTAVVVNDKVVKEKRFSCTDSIYVFVESDSSVQSIDVANVRWVDPAGAVVRSEKRNFIPIDDNNTYAWDGMEFDAGGGGLLSNIGMSFFDSSAGLEDVVGKWKVNVSLSSRENYSLSFEVMC